MVTVFFWVIFGGLAGWICALIDEPLRQEQTIAYIILGILGALVSGAIIHFLSGQGFMKVSIPSLLFPTFGAIFILYVVTFARRQS